MNTNTIAVTAISTVSILNSIDVAKLSRSIVKVVGIIMVNGVQILLFSRDSEECYEFRIISIVSHKDRLYVLYLGILLCSN